MKYISFTYVDSVTGISVAKQPAANGPAFPEIAGLEFVWARESRYPTLEPELFGTCDDGADLSAEGFLGEFNETDWDQMRADEMAARDPIPEEVEGWQAEFAMRITPVDPEDPESQSVWDRVQSIIEAMPNGSEKVTAQIVLQRGKIRRDSPMLAQLAPLVPLSQERVDDLLRLAHSIYA